MELDLNHDLQSLLPPFYREIAEYQQICDAEKAQFARTADSVQGIGQNFFVQTMDADSVQKWEQVLHIRAKPLTETLGFRRQRILSRLCTRPPFTLAFLCQQLDALLGVGRWTCRVDHPAYLLTIGTHVEDKLHREELIHMVNQIKPAHIAFQMYLFCDTVEASAYAAATPCRIASRYTVRLPDFVALPDAQAQAYTAGAAERMRITIEIGGNSL
nr:MAG TPA: tail protein [Caudoviricetes sp.]